MGYFETLQEPEWKSLAKKVKERDNFTCQYCGSKTNLHAHHLTYNVNYVSWDVSESDLITLCGTCHEVEHIKREYTPLERELIFMIRFQGGHSLNKFFNKHIIPIIKNG